MHWIKHKKSQLSAKYHFWKNQENQLKMVKNCQIVKNYNFEMAFLDFFRNGTLQRAEIFCAAFSASKSFFWAIKINILTNFLFFPPKGDPYNFGVVKSYTKWKKWLKQIREKKIWMIKPNGTWKCVVEVSSSQVVLLGAL